MRNNNNNNNYSSMWHWWVMQSFSLLGQQSSSSAFPSGKFMQYIFVCNCRETLSREAGSSFVQTNLIAPQSSIRTLKPHRWSWCCTISPAFAILTMLFVWGAGVSRYRLPCTAALGLVPQSTDFSRSSKRSFNVDFQVIYSPAVPQSLFVCRAPTV